ncbi:hypothetical protein D3C74_167160 [compost metagenome]
MNYRVEKDFLDRFDNFRHCKPGEPHIPPNDERAKQLLDQGFISVVEEKLTDDKASTEGKTSNRARKPKADVVKLGDADGEASAKQ